MLSNRSMPACAVVPELAYPDVEAATTWLCGAFGFRPRLRVGSHRAQLVMGGGAVVLTELAPGEARLPSEAAGFAHSVMVRVHDIDGHYAHARKRGAEILRAPADYPYGERQYAARDPGGHVWVFSETIADLAPEEWGGTVEPEA